MKPNKVVNILVNLLTIALVAMVWSLIMFLVVKDHSDDNILFAVGYGCGMLAFVLYALYLVIVGARVNRTLSDVRFIQYYIAYWYIVVCVIYNSFAVLSESDKAIRNVVIWNVIFFVLLVITALCIGAYISRVNNLKANVSGRMQNSINASAMLGGLLAITSDPQIKSSLLKLKQDVDMSSNLTQASSYDAEMQFGAALNEIQSLLYNGGADVNTVLTKIDGASKLWRLRNSNAASIR